MLRAAIDLFEKEMELESPRTSADLYSEIYSEDDDLKELTETAVIDGQNDNVEKRYDY